MALYPHAKRVGREAKEEDMNMDNIRTLDDLFDAIKRGAVDLDDALPVFGGAEPRDTASVWSWDPTRLLVGECVGNLEIVPRDAWRDA